MNSYLPVGTNRGIRIAVLKIADTGTYEQQWHRPYETVNNGDTASSLREIKNRLNPQSQIMPGLLTGLTNNLLQPVAQPERAIQIPNGWSEHRFRFIMVVEHKDPRFGVSTYEMVMGWTDHRGISSISGALDPNMVFYVNNTLSLRSVMTMTPTGQDMNFNIADNSQVIANEEYGGLRDPYTQYRMRPTDLFGTMDRTQIPAEVMRGTNDTRNVVTSIPEKSRRSNGVATSYVANLMETYKNAVILDAYGQSEEQVLEQARGNSLESPMTSDHFLSAIAQERGVMATRIFTWGDLIRLDPGVQSDQVTTVTLMGSPARVQNDGMHVAGRYNGWGETSRTTQIAAILASAVPALMMDLGFSQMVLTATNRTMGGRMEVLFGTVDDFASLAGARVDMSRQLVAFRSAFEERVLADISFGGHADFQITMAADLLGESIIDIEWNGGQRERFVVPSFSDAMMSPIITTSDDRAVKIAHDMQNIFSNTLGEVMSTAVAGAGPDVTGMFGHI